MHPPGERLALPARGRLFSGLGSLRDECANSLIEMALVLPVVFLLTFWFVNFCLVLFGMGNVNFASRAALRYATLHSATSYAPATTSDLTGIVTPYVFRYPSNTYSVTPTYYYGNTVSAGVCLAVRITYGFNAFGHVYNGLTYNTTSCGIIQQ